jgi:hypothetical protein
MFIDEINVLICGHRILLKSIESFLIFSMSTFVSRARASFSITKMVTTRDVAHKS